MAGFTVKLEGLKEVLQKLNTKNIEEKVQSSLATFGVGVEADAKQMAPTDESRLKNAIFYQLGKLEVTVGCSVDYAAYVEFGTRRFASEYVSSLPADWKTFAAQFKGPGGGSMDEFIKRIMEWVKRKGFAAQVTKSGNKSKSKSSQAQEDQAAYVIARSILINGIRAQPFLFPAVEKNRLKLLEDLKKMI